MVLGAETGLRIVRGSVNSSGNGALAGGGWTVSSLGTGERRVTFSAPFGGLPTITATCVTTDTGMIRREEWGAQYGTGSIDSTPKRTLVVHHTVSAPPRTYNTRAKRREHMRALERMHVVMNGWDAIGYNAVMFPAAGDLPPEIYEGRGLRRLPAAQASANSGTIAIAVVGDFRRDKLRRKGRRRLVKFANRCRRDFGVERLRGHRDFGGTTCPGDNLYRLLPNLRHAAKLN